jgi:hypothetical protein
MEHGVWRLKVKFEGKCGGTRESGRMQLVFAARWWNQSQEKVRAIVTMGLRAAHYRFYIRRLEQPGYAQRPELRVLALSVE